MIEDDYVISMTISVTIKRDPKLVYEFVLNLKNFPRWARSTFQSIRQLNAQGSVTIDITERNNFGILDHYVKLSSGAVIFVPMRVIKNGDGSELIFTLFQTAEIPEDKFAEDAKSVKEDLNILKNFGKGIECKTSDSVFLMSSMSYELATFLTQDIRILKIT